MDGSTSDSTIVIHRDAYRAAVEGEGDTVCEFYTREPTSPVNVLGDTVLHVLALYCHSEIVCRLLQLPLPEHGLMTKNTKGNIALHEAARFGCLKIAKAMVSKEPGLVLARNPLGETPLYCAAASGQKEMLQFLACIDGSENGLRRYDGRTILHAAVMGEYYSIPSIVYEQLLESSDGNPERGSCISGRIRRIFRWFSCIRKIDDEKQKHKSALKLAEHMIEKNVEWRYNIHDGGDPSSSWISGPQQNNNISSGRRRIEDPLLLATKLGIVEIVEEILEKFPEAIELLDSDGKNILHLAAEYRQESVFKFLKSKNFPIVRMIGDVDKDGNTPLHLAARLGDIQPRHVVGAQQQMPWELFWFKRMKHVSRPNFFPLKNSNGKTAKDLFNDTHRNLQHEAEKWSDDTTNAFMVISTLIATVAFTAAFQVPGGYSSDSGLPLLYQSKDFMLFLSYVTTALFFSLVTFGASISAHLSRSQKDDFYFSLPCKFIIAASALFNSVVFTITSFAQAIILETSGGTSPVYYSLGIIAIIIACILGSLIYIDTMYPVTRYLIEVFLHSISYHSQKKI